MTTMNTCAPLPELRATIVVIHPVKPDHCPECKAEVVSRCEKASGTEDNVVAYRCSGAGHRIHSFAL